MSRTLLVELSRESPELAEAELAAAVRARGGRVGGHVDAHGELLTVLFEGDAAQEMARVLALARRCLERRTSAPVPDRPGQTASFRRWGSPGGVASPVSQRRGADWKAAGGRIDLERPERRFWDLDGPPGTPELLEEVANVDRSAYESRRISRLPFRRPVGLHPRLARVAVNLAGVRVGDRVLDPFLGTGSLLAEALLLGAHGTGLDRDPEMVQGALRNFAHLGLDPEAVLVGDAGTLDLPEAAEYDALVTDAPYGRSSGTGGEDPVSTLGRVLPRWAERVVPDGPVVVVVPGGPDPLAPPWARTLALPLRVHRSLTREFRVYRRAR